MIGIVALFAAAWITPLPLPPYVTVPVLPLGSFRDRNPFAVGGDAVAAEVSPGMNDGLSRVVLWRGGVRIALPAAPAETDSSPHPFLQLGAVSPGGVLYVEQGVPFSGAYSGIDYTIFRLSAYGAWRPVAAAACGGDGYVAHVDGVDAAGSLDVTYESPKGISLDAARTGYAPSASTVNGARCGDMGEFNVRAVDGDCDERLR